MAHIANIGLAERRKRHRFGVVALLLGVALVIALRSAGLHPAVRAVSALLFFPGFTGIFQARAQTCVALASRGVRDMDQGPETIDDPEQLAAVRSQARRVLVRSVIATLVVTVASLLLP